MVALASRAEILGLLALLAFCLVSYVALTRRAGARVP
jgi:hypothetical protein